MTNGNGVFKWWTALNEDDEYYHGPFGSKEEAIAKGMAEYGGDTDHDRFFVMECDKSICTYGGIDERDLADQITESIAEGNEMCWGEDGWDNAWSEPAMASLADALKFTISGWLESNPAHTFMIANTRVSEKIDIVAAKAKAEAA